MREAARRLEHRPVPVLICLPYMSASYVWCSPPRPSYHLVLLYCCTLAPSTETLVDPRT